MTVDLDVAPPWTAVLTDGQHALLVYAVVGAGLALLATLVRLRFAAQEVHGAYRTASLTANAVVAIAFASYALITMTVLVGYDRTPAGWVPGDLAALAWTLRYVDWSVTVPLLVIELLAVSLVSTPRRTAQLRAVGVTLAFAMILLGFLGGAVVDDGRSFTTLLVFGLLSTACFAGLYALLLGVVLKSLPKMPPASRPAYRGAAIVLLVVWFVYPVVYGLQGTTSGGAWAVTGAVALSVADVVAKVGFGTLIHRTAVLRSRADEDASPTTVRRPRQPEADSLWVEDRTRLEPDSELRRD